MCLKYSLYPNKYSQKFKIFMTFVPINKITLCFEVNLQNY